jgi:ActR/RegA family two-component response regulator
MNLSGDGPSRSACQRRDGDGLMLLQRFKDAAPETRVILLTGVSSIESAVEVMKRGAFHYLNKPSSR